MEGVPMFINKLNQLYKPDRILYYTEPAEEDITGCIKQLETDKISDFSNSFGTYDYPGVFYVASLNKLVIGIEYRPDDDRVTYPSGLKSVNLEGAFYCSVEIDYEKDITIDYICNLFNKVNEDDDAHRVCTDLSIVDEPKVISIYPSGSKFRILYDFKVDEDRTSDIINDNYSIFGKEALYRSAYIDPITGHYNWNHLVPFLEMPMNAGIKDFAFVHFDIKEFRVINEVYGHVAANKVLANVANAMRESDFVYTSARCHNDNFAMLIKDMPEEETIATLRAFFDELSHLEEDANYTVYFRCGVVPMQRTLLLGNRVADAGKMSQALGTGRNVTDIVMYTDKMHEDVMWAAYIKAYLDTAIANDEFMVYLQPKFDIRQETIKGAEALVRWNYKGNEMLPPGRFVPFFERDGSIAKVDDIVLKKVCEAFARWKEEGRALYPISVNLSRDRLYAGNLVEHLTEIVDSYGVDHSFIDFELTESASYDSTGQMIEVLGRLRAKGFKISMDDFGTGYSSFSLLTQMPLDTLKIDKSFVDKVGIEDEEYNDIVVIKHIIALAKELGFVCLAEGAENKNQVDKLRTLGCDVIQGYYYSKPIPVKEYENYL